MWVISVGSGESWATPDSHKGTVEAFLLTCPSLSATRVELDIANLRFLHDHPHLDEVVTMCLTVNPVQFWLDCSTMHTIIKAVQSSGLDIPPLFVSEMEVRC